MLVEKTVGEVLPDVQNNHQNVSCCSLSLSLSLSLCLLFLCQSDSCYFSSSQLLKLTEGIKGRMTGIQKHMAEIQVCCEEKSRSPVLFVHVLIPLTMTKCFESFTIILGCGSMMCVCVRTCAGGSKFCV